MAEYQGTTAAMSTDNKMLRSRMNQIKSESKDGQNNFMRMSTKTDMQNSDRQPPFTSQATLTQKRNENELRISPKGTALSVLDGEIAKKFTMEGSKQSVIDYKVNKPLADMPVSHGVTVIEKGKSVRNGQDF